MGFKVFYDSDYQKEDQKATTTKKPRFCAVFLLFQLRYLRFVQEVLAFGVFFEIFFVVQVDHHGVFCH